MNLSRLILFLLSIYFICPVVTAKNVISGYIPVSGGAYLYYEECGKGEPIILLHGHSLDRRMWDDQFKVFSKHYRTVRFDFRGYGKSSAQTETFQFTHMDDLLTLMDSLHIQKAHIVGLSMGAFVASDLLSLHPERMLTCVLASGGLKAYKGPSEPMDSAERSRRDAEIAKLKEKGIEKMKQEWLDNLIASGGSQREHIRTALKQMIDDWTAWQPLHREVRVIMAKDALDVFKRTHPIVPTLIIEGGSTTNHNSKRPWMLDYLPNGESLILPDCGHMMNMEHPKEFNHVVMEFVGRHSVAK